MRVTVVSAAAVSLRMVFLVKMVMLICSSRW